MKRKRRRVVSMAGGPTRTQTQFQESCTLSTVCERYLSVTGRDPIHLPVQELRTMDLTKSGDFQETQEKMAEANANFMKLPSKIRKRFANNPGYLLEFVENEDNREEAIKLGLLPKPPKKVETPPEPPKQKPETPNVPDKGPITT